ncbi:diacylglycerol kinase family lipid kinase [Hyphobacterium sp. CCMP332]|nr:diacylglycerol kinase family lipid kinase [Hyphobacterium sp. CCMP332]
MNYLIVINPVSGDVDKSEFVSEAKDLLERNGHRAEVFKTTGKRDQVELEKKISELSPDRIIAGGGDGTILLCALAVIDENIPIGIVPLGSANGMAAELKINSEPIEALKEIMMSSRWIDIDILKVNEKHYSIHIGDVGTNAEIVHKFEKGKERGMVSYAKFFIEELRNSKPFKVAITTENNRIEENVIMLAICNGRTYGTGIPINVQGKPNDGVFELVIIKEVNFNALIKAGLSKIDERFFGDEAIEVFSAEKAEIKLGMKKNLQLDGEVIGEVSDLKIEIIPSAIKLVVNKE